MDEEDGHVEWALSAADFMSSPSVATDDRGDFAARLNKRTHRVVIAGVPGSTIHYNIVSGGGADPNGPYSVTVSTASLSAAPVGITGSITYADASPGRECLAYVRVERLFFGQTLKSLPINGLTDGGDFAADIKNIRLEGSLDQPLNFEANSDNTTIFVTAVCDPLNRGTVSKTTAAADKLIVGTKVAEYQNMDVIVAPAPTEVSADVPLVTGFNLIGIPVELTTPTTVRDFAESLLPAGVSIGDGPVISVLGWNAGAQAFTPWAAANPDTNVFVLQTGKGYFVRVKQDVVWSPAGNPISASVPIDFSVGFNLVSFPFITPAAGYTTRSLAEALLPPGTIFVRDGPVATVAWWDAAAQRYGLPWSSSAPSANITSIDPKAGYFVRVTQPIVFTP